MILLQNYEQGSRLLEYDPDSGKSMEVARELAGQAVGRGFYVSAGNDVVGVYASPGGPVFFVNGARYPMKDPSFGVELERGEREHHFVARHRGEPVFELRYPPRTSFGYDNWSKEASSADWFMWLVDSASVERFYQFLTASPTP